jgi:hypothetical protein
MTATRAHRRTGLLLGALIALAVPVSMLVVAFLWDRGVLTLEPNGAFVQTLQAIAIYEIFLGPLGVVIAGRAAGLRGLVPWLVLILLAIPALAVLWFIGVAYLGGLAGEPF